MLVTLGIAVVSAPACLVAHFVIAIYYCFQQIRLRPPCRLTPALDRTHGQMQKRAAVSTCLCPSTRAQPS